MKVLNGILTITARIDVNLKEKNNIDNKCKIGEVYRNRTLRLVFKHLDSLLRRERYYRTIKVERFFCYNLML